MNDAEMTSLISTMLGDGRFNTLIPTYLAIAKGAVINRMYPFESEAEWDDVPSKYHTNVCEITCYLINKRGAEGETSHSESGISRGYGSAGIPASMLDCIKPFVGLPR